ncbi:hypothetical protein KKA23_03245 [Patescibacteria group bacterium]|nr:hypothetical protein [Patescibacteria group bacterium]
MLTDKDIKKLIKAQKEIFPTAEMVKGGFDNMDKRFDKVDKRFDKVDDRLDKVENRLERIEQANEDIKLRLGNTAFQFDVNDLKKRVRKLEFKLGIKSR